VRRHPLKGRRFQLSAEGAKTFTPGLYARGGVIDGESRDRKCWWVFMNGHVSRSCIHKSFVELLPPSMRGHPGTGEPTS
jgi:hypothetical protein